MWNIKAINPICLKKKITDVKYFTHGRTNQNFLLTSRMLESESTTRRLGNRLTPSPSGPTNTHTVMLINICRNRGENNVSEQRTTE